MMCDCFQLFGNRSPALVRHPLFHMALRRKLAIPVGLSPPFDDRR